MKIRSYQEKDLPEILDLHKKAMQAVGAYKGDGPWDDDLKNIAENYREGAFIVGEEDGRILAMGAIRKIDRHTCEVKRMRTDPEFQGKGYGKAILSELIRSAKEKDYRKMILETSDKQIAAINLYRNSGFSEYKQENIDGFNCTWYQLEL